MHSADYAVARCLSVRLSVRPSHADIVSKRLYISSKYFSPPANPVFKATQFFDAEYLING